MQEENENNCGSARCFYDRNHPPISVSSEVFDDLGYIKSEYKGKILSNGVYVGHVGIYCSIKCRDDFCGPRQEKDEEEEARMLEERCRKREEWERELKKEKELEKKKELNERADKELE